jgi:molybdopterin/thiamine biosynthesis adenylyltransferase/rhodanese-related sulfurtransferase
MDDLSAGELMRYSRHLVLPGFGKEKQLKLKGSRVLVVGAGGLGSPVLLYLAAAGVGHIGIVDFDTVQTSNLQRQVIFTTAQTGINKAMAAAERLSLLNPHIAVVPHTQQLTSDNILNIIRDYDVVIDGSDNFPTRYLVNDACVLSNKPLVYGAVLTFEGQVAVFNHHDSQGWSSNYRDVFPQPPSPDSVPNCEQAGVLGVMPGLIGTLMATEAIKLITGSGDLLVNKLLVVDALSMEFTTLKTRVQSARDTIKNLIDYEDFCGVNERKNKSLGMKEITVQELAELLQSKADFQLIDVREPHEFDICNLGGQLIPLAEIPEHVGEISKARKVVIHCRSGGRSGQAIKWLEKNHQFENLYNLQGGILAWAQHIDPSMPTY